jgi:hypothetical protein
VLELPAACAAVRRSQLLHAPADLQMTLIINNVSHGKTACDKFVDVP